MYNSRGRNLLCVIGTWSFLLAAGWARRSHLRVRSWLVRLGALVHHGREGRGTQTQTPHEEYLAPGIIQALFTIGANKAIQDAIIISCRTVVCNTVNTKSGPVSGTYTTLSHFCHH